MRRNLRKSQDETRPIRDNSMQSLLLVLECFANSNIWSQTLENNRVIWGTSIGLGRKQCVRTACFLVQDSSASQLQKPLSTKTAELREDIWDNSWPWEVPVYQSSCFLLSPFTGNNQAVSNSGFPRYPVQSGCSMGSSPHFVSEPTGAKAAPAFLLHGFFSREKWWCHTVLQEVELPLTPLIQEMLHPKAAEDTLQINPQEAVLGRLPEGKWYRIIWVLNSNVPQSLPELQPPTQTDA